jgi:hypothetical protein
MVDIVELQLRGSKGGGDRMMGKQVNLGKRLDDISLSG